MRKILTAIEWTVSRLGFSLLLIMTFVIVLQVFMRYVLNDSLMWPEEMTRYCFLWASMLAVVLTEEKGGHLRITVLQEFSPPVIKKALNIFGSITNIAFYIILIWLSVGMTIMVNDMEQYAVSFELPMVYVWLAFPILCTTAVLFAFINFSDKSTKN